MKGLIALLARRGMTDRWRNPCRRPVGAPGDNWDEWYAHTSNTQLRILLGARHACARLRKQRDDARTDYQFMVDRACNAKLDGYRKLGERAARAEEERDEASKRERLAWSAEHRMRDLRDDALMQLSEVVSERDAAREELHLRVSQLTEDHRTELARLRKELAEVTTSKWTPGTESSPTGGGDFEERCNCCGETVDGPHTWEACATGLVKERDRLVDSLSGVASR